MKDPHTTTIKVTAEQMDRILSSLARVKYAGWKLERLLKQVAELVPYRQRRSVMVKDRPSAKQLDAELLELQEAILAVVYVSQRDMEQLTKGH